MTPRQIYEGSNGEATKELYAKLTALGPAGVIATNLFRACKCSERAKVYRGGGYKRDAYERKNWNLENLTRALEKEGDTMGMIWGWRKDPNQEYHNQVLYVELPGWGQVSFHSATRFNSTREYHMDWDGSKHSAERIIGYVTKMLEEVISPATMAPLTIQQS